MPVIRLSYAHHRGTGAPSRMNAAAVWRVASDARRQLCPNPRRLAIDVGNILRRLRLVDANGLALDVHVELTERLEDSTHRPVFGQTAHDRRWPGYVRVSLNTSLIGSHEPLMRSTLLHELGHVVFDAPAWTLRARSDDRLYLYLKSADDPNHSGIDWSEWRANEFMGAFLAPQGLLHSAMVKRAAASSLPLREDHRGIPILDDCSVAEDRFMALVYELAEMFGLSDAFIATRLQKYRLIASAQTPDYRHASAAA